MKDDLKNQRPDRSLYSVTNSMEQARWRYDRECQQLANAHMERARSDARMAFMIGLTVFVVSALVVVIACWELF